MRAICKRLRLHLRTYVERCAEIFISQKYKYDNVKMPNVCRLDLPCISREYLIIYIIIARRVVRGFLRNFKPIARNCGFNWRRELAENEYQFSTYMICLLFGILNTRLAYKFGARCRNKNRTKDHLLRNEKMTGYFARLYLRNDLIEF